MRRPKLKNLLFAAVFPLVWVLFFALLEASLTGFGYGRDYSLFERVDPGVLTDNADHVRRFFAWSATADPGERSNLIVEGKNPANRRIFVVGGSTAQGFPYHRNHSFTGIAQAALRSVGMDLDIVNVGNSAMSSYYTRDVLREVQDLEPDMVVVYAGHNEYYGTVSAFSGGTHALRLAALRLKKYRTVQLLESLAFTSVRDRRDGGGLTLMEQRFADAPFPADETRDARVADLFVRNVRAGLGPLADRGVPALVFEPVSNLVSMPPFRSGAAVGGRGGTPPAFSGQPASAVDLYRRATVELDSGRWNRSRWEQVKDLDMVPFRARSVLASRLRDYASSHPGLRWIPTADEFERRVGHAAFTDAYFIDHVHFNFEGQVLLASILAEAILDEFHPGDAPPRARLARYLADFDGIRQDIHLTGFWEFHAYGRIYNMIEREPFLSMPISKRHPAIPERVLANSLFRTDDFLNSLRGASNPDPFPLALERYRSLGDKDEWIANMDAYVYLLPGQFETHLMYGLALLADDPVAHLEPAGNYFRRAYFLSHRSPVVVEVVRSELHSRGLAASWEPFRQRYLP